MKYCQQFAGFYRQTTCNWQNLLRGACSEDSTLGIVEFPAFVTKESLEGAAWVVKRLYSNRRWNEASPIRLVDQKCGFRFYFLFLFCFHLEAPLFSMLLRSTWLIKQFHEYLAFRYLCKGSSGYAGFGYVVITRRISRADLIYTCVHPRGCLC